MRAFSEEQIKQAKSVSILGILQNNGFESIKQDATGYWFNSPFRNEKTPSFVVYTDTNTFCDWGTDLAGDVILLVQKLKNIDFVGAVKTLLQCENFSFISPNISRKPQETPKITIEAIKPISNKFFINYLFSRKINISIAQNYLQEIYYKTSPNQEKNFFGLGIQNQSKCYEIKNCKTGKYYCLGLKDITVIENPASQSWSIFEGIFDFLASLSFYQKPIRTNVLVLNTVSLVSKVFNHIPSDIENLYLFLDNDDAGEKATKQLTEHYSQNTKTYDCRHLYNAYKDFNDFLISRGEN